jgi:predicted acyl esterase
MKNMKRHLFSIVLLFSLNAKSQVINQDSAWFRENYYKIEKAIPMRDGVKLFTSIYVPKDSTEKHPILIERTPYSAAPYGPDRYRDFWSGYERYFLRE